MLAAVVRHVAERLIRLYYPERELEHGERLPASGPVIFVLNHPNGLLDPLLLAVTAGRPVRFLAKSTLFGNPFGRLAMRAFGCVPVYRAQDVPGADGPGTPARSFDRNAANEATFARCRELLAAGEALALFPEGVSHSDPQLKPLKTGAARIALSSADAHAGAAPGLRVVPVGLAYEAKTVFRSRVLLVVGEPLRVPDASADDREAADRFTEEIRAALDEVVLQAESRDLLAGVARVAAWTTPAPAPDLAAQHRRARELMTAYQARTREDVEPIVRAARDYTRILRRLGVRDPWSLEIEPVRPLAGLLAIARLVVAAPVALVGLVLGWLPYRLAGQVARRVTRDEDVLGTVKLLAGSLFLLLFWSAEAVAAGIAAGAGWALATLLIAPASGYVALRFDELTAEMRESARHLWLRAVRPRQVIRLAERRRALADAIARALRGGS